MLGCSCFFVVENNLFEKDILRGNVFKQAFTVLFHFFKFRLQKLFQKYFPPTQTTVCHKDASKHSFSIRYHFFFINYKRITNMYVLTKNEAVRNIRGGRPAHPCASHQGSTTAARPCASHEKASRRVWCLRVFEKVLKIWEC